MHFETGDARVSLALALMPGGNVVKALSDARASLARARGLAGYRAYFDFPVAAWLSEPLRGPELASLATLFDFPLVLDRLTAVGGSLFYGFSDETAASMERMPIPNRFGAGNGAASYAYGPFPSGTGLYCGDEVALRDSLPALPPIRSRTYSLSLVELRWYDDETFASSWATLSSAWAGRKNPR